MHLFHCVTKYDVGGYLNNIPKVRPHEYFEKRRIRGESREVSIEIKQRYMLFGGCVSNRSKIYLRSLNM